MITYRGDGDWGTGKGSNLTAAEVDTNFYELQNAIDAALTGLDTPVGIDEITYDNGSITFVLTDASEQGPFDLPVAVFNWRGRYASGAEYAEMDAFFHPSYGGYLVTRAHTAPSSFDPDLLVTGFAAYFKMFSLIPGGINPSRNEATTDYTLAVATDSSKYVRMTNASPSIVRIPSEADEDFPLWAEIMVRAQGNASVTFLPADTDVTINYPEEGTSTAKQGDVAYLKKVDTDEWDLWYASTFIAPEVTETDTSTGSETDTSTASDPGTGSDTSFPGNIYSQDTTSDTRVGALHPVGYTDPVQGQIVNPIDGLTITRLLDNPDSSYASLGIAGDYSGYTSAEVTFFDLSTGGTDVVVFDFAVYTAGSSLFHNFDGLLGLADDTWYNISVSLIS